MFSNVFQEGSGDFAERRKKRLFGGFCSESIVYSVVSFRRLRNEDLQDSENNFQYDFHKNAVNSAL